MKTNSLSNDAFNMIVGQTDYLSQLGCNDEHETVERCNSCSYFLLQLMRSFGANLGSTHGLVSVEGYAPRHHCIVSSQTLVSLVYRTYRGGFRGG